MESNIEKPISVIRQEFIDTLIKDINDSKLPLFVIEPILKGLYTEVKIASQRQYEIEKSQYENALRDSLKEKELLANT